MIWTTSLIIYGECLSERTGAWRDTFRLRWLLKKIWLVLWATGVPIFVLRRRSQSAEEFAVGMACCEHWKTWRLKVKFLKWENSIDFVGVGRKVYQKWAA